MFDLLVAAKLRNLDLTSLLGRLRHDYLLAFEHFAQVRPGSRLASRSPETTSFNRFRPLYAYVGIFLLTPDHLILERVVFYQSVFLLRRDSDADLVC